MLGYIPVDECLTDNYTGPHIVSGPPGPRVSRILENSGISASSYSSPIVEKARGIYIEDPDGNVFLDLISGRCVANTGYNHPHIMNALRSQISKSIHWQTEGSYRLLERLSGLLNEENIQVYWGQSGSMANEFAMKAVRRATRRPYILSFTGSYHGSSMGALSLSGYDPSMKRYYGPTVPGIFHVPYAACYRCPMKHEYPECEFACLSYIEDIVLKSYLPADEVAAIFVEPVQGDSGWYVPPEGWHKRLREICDSHNMLLVADEIQTAFGRTGEWFGMDHWGVKPDVTLLGKSISSGVPLSACLLPRDILESTDSEPIPLHAQSFSANPLGIAAAHATLDVIEKDDLCKNSDVIGSYMKQRLFDLMEDHSIIGDVRGLGLLIGVEIIKDRDQKTPAPLEAAAICKEAFKRGLFILNMGSYGGRSLRIAPPLIINEEQVDVAIEIIEESIEIVEKSNYTV
ncbi:aminotransferase class III-fold pyridoxal phosphate-dependent enzyme [Candidatus Bathyarchaeota archaeon]|nr:aminotransferase class III-fold pyridoxal phosphate-dependent enzyme [Candidatus Bathyarchaeota archaeon]